MAYQGDLLAHLADYKRSILAIRQPGLFRYRGTNVQRDHILPLTSADLNLFPLARDLAAALSSSNPDIVRHRYFHHLNSSQAFAFNLFLPFFSGSASASGALLRQLTQTAQLTSWELEAVPDPVEGTNLDAQWVTDDGTTTICEVKLSEAEFGKAADDARHRDKLARIYQPVLSGCVPPALLNAPMFFEVYQILRNVWHLARLQNGRLVFLLPRANTNLWATLTQVLGQVAPPTRSRIAIIAIEDVLQGLAADANCPSDMRIYAKGLSLKYVP